MHVTIYTDGSSRGNPGPGGWAAIIMTQGLGQRVEGKDAFSDDQVIELGGREDITTNNRMELSGTIYGLRAVGGKQLIVMSDSLNPTPPTLHPVSVEVCTDSQYVKKGITEWISGWIKNNWKNSQKKDVLNRDLWEDLKKEVDRLEKSGVKVTFKYVPGHSGVPLNERADVIATSLADESNIELYRGNKEDYRIRV